MCVADEQEDYQWLGLSFDNTASSQHEYPRVFLKPYLDVLVKTLLFAPPNHV